MHTILDFGYWLHIIHTILEMHISFPFLYLPKFNMIKNSQGGKRWLLLYFHLLEQIDLHKPEEKKCMIER